MLHAEEVLASAKSVLKKLKKDQYWAIFILSTTLLVLFFFYYEIGQFGDWKLVIGLTLMLASLGVRLFLEFLSRLQIRKLQPHQATRFFVEKLHSYYQKRRQIHFVLTPIIYLIYGVGLILFLVAIQPHLSSVFFVYCLISGLGFWLGFIWVIRKSYRQEREILDQLEKAFF
jgi:cell division protein FtsW (lipid II flippase)